MGRLDGRVTLVTGASRGLGAAVARRLAAEGAHVVLAARTAGGLEETDDAIRAVGGSATLVPCDLIDPTTPDRLALAVHQRFGRLDALVGCAAMLGELAPAGHIASKLWQQVFAVNVAANQGLIRAFDQALRASPAGRAVFVTAPEAEGAVPYWGAYAASKAALEMLILIYAAEVAHTRVRVNLVRPGPMRTKLRARAFPGEAPDKAAAPEAYAEAFVDLVTAEESRNGWVISDVPRGDSGAVPG